MNMQDRNTELIDEASKILAKEGKEHVIAVVRTLISAFYSYKR